MTLNNQQITCITTKFTANRICERSETHTNVHSCNLHIIIALTVAAHMRIIMAILFTLTGSNTSIELHANALRHFLGTCKLFAFSVFLVDSSETYQFMINLL